MNRLIAVGLVGLALTATAVAAPPSSRSTMPAPTIRIVTPARPVAPSVIVVPTTPAPRPYAMPSRYVSPSPYVTPPIIAPRTYAVFYRYDWLSPGFYYGTFTSHRRAHDVAFMLEYFYGVDAWVR
jgi:hypothetical protein